MIHFFICLGQNGTVRLQRYFVKYSNNIQKEILNIIKLSIDNKDKDEKSHHFILKLENPLLQLIFKRYNGLYFILGIENNDSSLLALESIPFFVELLDAYFVNVCELDLVYNVPIVYRILDEIFLGGSFVLADKEKILNNVKLLDSVFTL